ncbi:hypothetical protein EI71_01605 [Anaeroplasma bactoclasticum]|jgi:argininosuccinate lyase|uniref:Uncharacterized protein n=1 Tax=Anaeroplasma bactoclasticum TaxID=2088 RepID=A0A397R936_9MOLU|nr:hypothetical protein [Anaeroplasma bactoclasticum]RIA66494.1 hypothetical protein EI71_01605 [Anaeroplasma bactoclasticum]
MEDLIEFVVGLVVVGVYDYTEGGGFEGNPDYTSKELMAGIKYGTDIEKINYEKDIYKELKDMRFRGVISKDEYNKLVLHQKRVDERNKQFKKILNMKCETKEESKKVLNELKKMVSEFYSKNEISKETYEEALSKIEDRLIQLNNEKK